MTDRSSGSLDLDIRVTRGDFKLEVDVTVRAGEILAVIGANGAGKSTLLGAIAGSLPVVSGHVRLGSRTLSATHPGTRDVFVTRANRRAGHLDQRARLFPHLDARANIAFGPRAQGVNRKTANALAGDWLSRVGLIDRQSARASELSGGQQQRVAIARTFAASPDVVLLDEPFAALDVASSDALRRLVRAEIQRLGVPTVLITHDPVDVIGLADSVLVLEDGQAGQYGTIADVLGRPATPFAAEFTGRVLVEGAAGPESTLLVDESPISALVGTHSDTNSGAHSDAHPGTRVSASYDPAAVVLTPARTETIGPLSPVPDPRNAWVGTIRSISSHASGLRIECVEWAGFIASVPLARAVDPDLVIGSRVRMELPAHELHFQ